MAADEPDTRLATAAIAALEKRLEHLQAELLRYSAELQGTNDKLAQSERSAQALLTNVPGMVFRAQAHSPFRVHYASDGIEKLTGYPPAHFVADGHPYVELMFEEDVARVDAELGAQAAAGLPMVTEYRIRRADGSERWVEGRARMVDGEPGLIDGTVFDIDERKRAGQALQETREHLRYLIQAVPSVLWTAGPDGALDFVSSAGDRSLTEASQASMGHGWLDFVHPDDVDAARTRWQQSVDSGELYEVRFRLRDAQGGYHWHQVCASSRRDAAGRILRWYGITTDVDDLASAQARAEEAARAKSAFLSTMSHEIRTPLNAVLGFADLLADTELVAQQRDFVNSIRASGDHLLGVINDILDFSKLESGRLPLDLVPCDLRLTVEAALDLVANQAAPKNLELVYRMDEAVPASCLLDAARLRQVLVNLLSNAVKFTSEGEVEVRISARALGDDACELAFHVRDTGIGIPADRLHLLFRDFSQVDDSAARRFGGTGLGLAICKRVVEAQGGSISVESQPGSGSVFSFRLPTKACATPAPMPAASPENLLGRRALLVDDNRSNMEILCAQVKAWGMDAVCLHEPLRALEVMRRAIDHGRPFELAIVDQQMPGIDGLELTRRLHAMAPIPVVLLTSLGTTLASAHAAGARVAASQSKPLHRSLLFETLCGVLTARPAGAAPAPGHAPVMPPLRLLLVEDNLVNRKVATLLLRKLGYDAIDLATDGLEAVEAVSRRTYDAVLMDMQMPNLDGLAATRRIRGEPTASRQPQIIAMTANAASEDRDACLAAGMDDYLAKPIVLSQLTDALLRAAQRIGIVAAPPRLRPSPREDADARARRIAEQVLAGGGEMGALMRRIDWSQTPLGPVYTWPQSLRSALSIVLTQRQPMLLWWGRELVQFYNDAYRPILGSGKHPAAMGQRGRETWPDIWDVIGPLVEAVIERGESTLVERGLLCLYRNGYFEEGFYTYGYSAIRDESGGIGGVLVACAENTAEVIGARRDALLIEIDDRLAHPAADEPLGWETLSALLAQASADLAFALVYQIAEDQASARLVCASGLPAGSIDAPPGLLADDALWPVFQCAGEQRALLLEDLDRLPVLPPWPEAPRRALLLPASGDVVLIAGISARLPLTPGYRLFLQKLATRIGQIGRR